METWVVNYSVDGKMGYSIAVQAPNGATAQRIALGQVQGMPGFADKRIGICGSHKV